MCEHSWAEIFYQTSLNKHFILEDKAVEMTERDHSLLIELSYYDDEVVKECSKYLPNKELYDYLATQKRHNEPLRWKSIVKFLEEGGNLHIENEVSGNMIITTIGHLCDRLKPRIDKCVDEKKCTYSVTKDNFIQQEGYRCLTCFPEIPDHSICASCALSHKDHNLVLLSSNSHLFCDMRIE